MDRIIHLLEELAFRHHDVVEDLDDGTLGGKSVLPPFFEALEGTGQILTPDGAVVGEGGRVPQRDRAEAFWGVGGDGHFVDEEGEIRASFVEEEDGGNVHHEPTWEFPKRREGLSHLLGVDDGGGGGGAPSLEEGDTKGLLVLVLAREDFGDEDLLLSGDFV